MSTIIHICTTAKQKHTIIAQAEVLNDVFDRFGMEASVEQLNDDVILVIVNADDVSFVY